MSYFENLNNHDASYDDSAPKWLNMIVERKCRENNKEKSYFMIRLGYDQKFEIKFMKMGSL